MSHLRSARVFFADLPPLVLIPPLFEGDLSASFDSSLTGLATLKRGHSLGVHVGGHAILFKSARNRRGFMGRAVAGGRGEELG